MSNVRIRGPGRYREVREAYRKNVVLVAPLHTGVARSYDQTTEQINEY